GGKMLFTCRWVFLETPAYAQLLKCDTLAYNDLSTTNRGCCSDVRRCDSVNRYRYGLIIIRFIFWFITSCGKYHRCH
ncbi:MAG: hypothetical protein IKH44_00875, partial [Bacteroidales bacterium]|nr:hypothetical protein [Bacteroidales bacterium]